MKEAFPVKKLLALVLIVLTCLIATASFRYDSIAVRLEYASENVTDSLGMAKAFLFDEEGQLISEVATDRLSFNVPINQIQGDLEGRRAKNYALRVIADGQLGVLWFSDHELHSQKTLVVEMRTIPNQSQSQTSNTKLSDGFVIREAVYPWGVHFTTVGEVHACAKMYSTVEFARNSEIGIQVKKRWADGNDWLDIGYSYQAIDGSVYTTPIHTYPNDSLVGGREIQREYEYEMHVWAQYDGNGDLVTRWEELKATRPIGSLKWGSYVAGDCKPYDQVQYWQHGARELMMGGSSLYRECNRSHTYSSATKIGSIELKGITAYRSGSRTYYTFHTYGNPNDKYPNYGVYSLAGGISNPAWPRMLFTHD